MALQRSARCALGAARSRRQSRLELALQADGSGWGRGARLPHLELALLMRQHSSPSRQLPCPPKQYTLGAVFFFPFFLPHLELALLLRQHARVHALKQARLVQLLDVLAQLLPRARKACAGIGSSTAMINGAGNVVLDVLAQPLPREGEACRSGQGSPQAQQLAHVQRRRTQRPNKSATGPTLGSPFWQLSAANRSSSEGMPSPTGRPSARISEQKKEPSGPTAVPASSSPVEGKASGRVGGEHE